VIRGEAGAAVKASAWTRFREAVALDDQRGDLKILKLSDLNTEIDSYVAFHGERPLSLSTIFLAFLRQLQQKPGCGVKSRYG
jgi:hypothetical protein